ncbi:hypothetical protein [Sphingomonas sp. R1]|uniref:hypothetical protein n=1 Tax=Sphingomonas sp. R1 TaxID=399176 RepID=UPI00222500DE|nr:hypothetical protein [Sphingomonas sp. R1]UYY77480.1 hypothetical protein OIM94_00255 [Sphingomonas sp. R1]
MKIIISANLEAYLRSWHKTSTTQKIKDGIYVDLSFSDFLNLFSKKQLVSLEKHIAENSIRYLMSPENPYAYVLTWASYNACSTRVFNKETACITSRMKSEKINKPQKGDKLRESHKVSISKGLKDKPKSEEHRKNISESMKGQKRGPMSDEQKAIRSAKATARWERVRAEKAAQAQN